MSGFSSQGVGAAACAKADDASPVSTAAIKKVLQKVLQEFLVISLVMSSLPAANSASAPSLLNKSRTALISQLPPSPHHACPATL
jgi:hypothetical protein